MQIYNSIHINSNKNDNISFSAKIIPPKIVKNLESRMIEADSIDIFCHISPDEDTVNSAKALANMLISLKKKVRIFAEGKLNGILLNNNDRSIIHNPAILKEFDKSNLAIVVDFNSKSRLSEQANNLLNKYQKDEIIGLDHHHQAAAPEDVIGNINPDSNSPFYIDATAKSCCGVIYRFFEGLGKKLDENNLSNLYCGMLDDLMKSGCVTIDSMNGNYKVERTKSIYKNKETIEILDNIERNLSKVKQEEILRHLDILSNLTQEAKAFQEKLFREKVQIIGNEKLAYVVIPPDDSEWISLGQDNIVTSKILSNLRQRLLKKSLDDTFISDDLRAKLKNVKGVAVFYRGQALDIPTEEVYKVSMHSRDGYAMELVKKVSESNKTLSAGGHSNRVGGRIYSTDTQKCMNMVQSFIDAANALVL
jgi:nanoRNase/pAp phosphatase (c-di-AMP/oligoRNAs hydrolase)